MLVNISQTLERGLKVLEIVDAASEPMGVREIARQVDIATSIVQRLVNTLEARGYVEQVADTRRYRIGYRSIVLGHSSRHGDALSRAAQNELQSLAEQYGLNGYLGVLSGHQAVYVLSVPSRSRLVVRVDAGETMPLHATALGRVLLASQSEQRASELLGASPLARLTDKTITEPVRILAMLPEIRRTGYSLADEENLPGVVSAGAPVRNETGKIVAGISAAYAKGTTPLSLEAVTDLVVDAARRVSRSLGCPETALTEWGARDG